MTGNNNKEEVILPNLKANENTLFWTNTINNDEIKFSAKYGFIAGKEQIIIINAFIKKGNKDYQVNNYPIILPKTIMLELLQADWFQIENENERECGCNA